MAGLTTREPPVIGKPCMEDGTGGPREASGGEKHAQVFADRVKIRDSER